jgi:type IV secretion system protein VirD4
MDYLDSVLIAAVTAKSTFRFEDVLEGRADCYVVVPPEQLIPQANFLRLITTCMYLAQVRYGSERTPVLYLLDEIGNLSGGLEAVERALTIGRGYGARLLLFVQSLGQLKSLFPKKEEIILSCLDTQLYFGINDYETAHLVSKRLGQTTVHTVSSNENGGWSRSYSDYGHLSSSVSSSGGWSRGVSETGQALLTPDEVTQLPDCAVILFHRNNPPALIELAPHDKSPELWGTASEVGPKNWGAMLAASVILAIFTTVCVVGLFGAIQDAKRHAPSLTMPVQMKGLR